MTEAATETNALAKPRRTTQPKIESNGSDPLAQHKLLLTYFRYEHLSERLQGYSKPFHGLAGKIVRATKAAEMEPSEALVALRKLLEAKDAAVRAAL